MGQGKDLVLGDYWQLQATTGKLRVALDNLWKVKGALYDGEEGCREGIPWWVLGKLSVP